MPVASWPMVLEHSDNDESLYSSARTCSTADMDWERTSAKLHTKALGAEERRNDHYKCGKPGGGRASPSAISRVSFQSHGGLILSKTLITSSHQGKRYHVCWPLGRCNRAQDEPNSSRLRDRAARDSCATRCACESFQTYKRCGQPVKMMPKILSMTHAKRARHCSDRSLLQIDRGFLYCIFGVG